MSISGTEWVIIAAVIVLLFARPQAWQLMMNAGRGLTGLRRGLAGPADAADSGTGPPVAGA
jgi:Sec-independent protein translocase protein TatA